MTIKETTTAGFASVALFVLLPRLEASADAATGPTAQTFTIAERLPLAIAPSVAVALLVFNVVLAVYKPGGRLRVRPKRAPGKDLP